MQHLGGHEDGRDLGKVRQNGPWSASGAERFFLVAPQCPQDDVPMFDFPCWFPMSPMSHVGTCWNIDSIFDWILTSRKLKHWSTHRRPFQKFHRARSKTIGLEQQNLTGLEICCEDAVWPALAEQVVLLTREARRLEE